jgi:hypothetical protein
VCKDLQSDWKENHILKALFKGLFSKEIWKIAPYLRYGKRKNGQIRIAQD